MKSIYVRLPNKPTISIDELAACIVAAIDSDLSYAEGMDCIIGKAVVARTRNYIPLTHEEYQALEAKLGGLPLLHGKMNREELKEFYRMFDIKLKGPGWKAKIFDYDIWQSNRETRLRLKEFLITDIESHVPVNSSLAIDSHNQNQYRPIHYLKRKPDETLIAMSTAIEIIPNLSIKYNLIPVWYELDSSENTLQRQQASLQILTGSLLESEYQSGLAEQISISGPMPEAETLQHVTSVEKQTTPETQTFSARASDPTEQPEIEQPKETRPSLIPISATNVKINYVKEVTGLGETTIYAKMDLKNPYYDPSFPKNFKMNKFTEVPAKQNSASFWDKDEVDAWVVSSRGSREILKAWRKPTMRNKA